MHTRFPFREIFTVTTKHGLCFFHSNHPVQLRQYWNHLETEGTERPFSHLIKTSGQEAWECYAIVPLSDFVSGYAPIHPAIATIILGKNLNPKRAHIPGRREHSLSWISWETFTYTVFTNMACQLFQLHEKLDYEDFTQRVYVITPHN